MQRLEIESQTILRRAKHVEESILVAKELRAERRRAEGKGFILVCVSLNFSWINSWCELVEAVSLLKSSQQHFSLHTEN